MKDKDYRFRIIDTSGHTFKEGGYVRKATLEDNLGAFSKDQISTLFVNRAGLVQTLRSKHYIEEKDMSENVADNIEAILAELGSRREPEVEVEAALMPELTGTDWEENANGTASRSVPFSAIFWKPKSVPDHLVREFKGFNSMDPMATYVPPIREFEELSLAFSLGLKINVVGPTGCGKDTIFEYYAARTGRPYLRIQHDSSFDPCAVFGQVHITGGDTDFVPGTLPKSMPEPTLVTLSELTRSTGASNMVYQRLLDRNELALPELKDTTKAVIKPHSDWLICASDNTKGNGEDLDKYPMSNVQDGAFLNRWDMIIEADYLSEAQEKELIKVLSPAMDKRDIDRLAKLSNVLHAGYKKGDVQTAFSPRNLQAIAKLVSAGVLLRQAINMNYVSRCSMSEKPDVDECIRAVFGA